MEPFRSAESVCGAQPMRVDSYRPTQCHYSVSVIAKWHKICLRSKGFEIMAIWKCIYMVFIHVF